MALSEIDYTIDQKRLLDFLAEIGVVLETVILKPDSTVNDVFQASKSAALEGMEILAERHRKWFEETNPELSTENYFTIKILPDEELTGKRIDFSAFMGNGYTFETETLHLFSYNFNLKTRLSTIKEGFASALLNPPYSLHFDRVGRFASETYAESERLFYKRIIKDYLAILLQLTTTDDTKNLIILSWSDNWSTYFEDGKEWWGTFCWTLYNTRIETITFIVASSTD